MNLYRNEKLLEAFDLYVREQDALLPTEEELSTITLSPEFQAKMERMLTLRKRGYYHMFGTWGRRVASILIALLVATTTVTVSVKALREKVIEFFTEVFDTHTVVTFADDTPDVPDEITFEPRKPSYIPNGYVVESEEAANAVCRISYVNRNGVRVTYRQRLKDNNSMIADTEGTHTSEISIGTYYGVSYINKGILFIVFADEEYVYTISGDLEKEELIKISESILKK